MINETLFETQEKIIRRVSPSGNGAHIFAPKEWVDEEVLIVRISKLDIKKEIFKILEPFMENIVSVILFGSYSRGEQNEHSDIDVLVISNKPFKIKKQGFDFIVISANKFNKAMRINPILIYSAINEGLPIINSLFLEELKKEKINFDYFKEFIISTKKNLKSNKEIIELDKLQNKDYVSDSVIYSLFLRLRGIFIINCLLNKRKYSNNLFKNWICKKIKSINYDDFYAVYVSVRDNKKTMKKINIEIGEALIVLLKSELNKLINKNGK